MYQNADMKTKIYPTLDKIPDFLKKADEPEAAARDTRDLMYLLARISYANSRLAGHIITRKMGFASFDWMIESDDEKLIQRIRPFIKAIIDNYLNAPLFGIMGIQLMWQQTPEWGFQLVNYKRFTPIELDYQTDSLLIIDQDTNVKKEIKPDNEEYFYFIYPTPDRGGIMRSIIIPELLRHTTVIDWKNLNQRMKGIVSASIDVDKLEKAMDYLQMSETEKAAQLANIDASMNAVGTQSWMRHLNYADVQFKSLVEGTAGSSYEKFKQELDADISIAILGQANTSELPASGGSRAALQVLNLIRNDILLNDMLNIKDLANKALLIDYRKNMDKTAIAAPYQFEWVYDDNSDIEAYARVFETIARSPVPVAIDKNEYYTKLGLSVPAEGNEVIELGGASAPTL